MLPNIINQAIMGYVLVLIALGLGILADSREVQFLAITGLALSYLSEQAVIHGKDEGYKAAICLQLCSMGSVAFAYVYYFLFT